MWFLGGKREEQSVKVRWRRHELGCVGEMVDNGKVGRSRDEQLIH